MDECVGQFSRFHSLTEREPSSGNETEHETGWITLRIILNEAKRQLLDSKESSAD